MKKQFIILALLLCLFSVFAAEHTHSWVFSSEDNKISAYCSETQNAGDCEFQGAGNSISLTVLSNQSMLVPTVTPNGIKSEDIYFESSDASIASVGYDTGLVDAKKVGDGIITAAASDGSQKKATAPVKVRKYVPVTYNSRGGNLSFTNYEAEGEKLSGFVTPTNVNQKFVGWYKEENCENKWDYDSDTVPVGGTTLYAKWQFLGYTYLDPVYNSPTDITQGLKGWNTEYILSCTPVTSSTNEMTSSDWYVVDGSVTVSDRIVCNGDVKLILLDNSTLKALSGITVTGSNSLTIYAQSTGSTMGKLYTTGTDEAAGIGGGDDEAGNNITINGGYITAIGGIDAAGIGGGNHGAGNNITINGGNVTAKGGSSDKWYGASGIGGGNQGAGNYICINGGTLTAYSGLHGAGIGGGDVAGSNYLTINGGTITATGGVDGAGIGASGDCKNTTITGGTITATGGYHAAGIGGSICSDMTITGGTITAKGGIGGAGIGSGSSAGGGGQGSGRCEYINIWGGNITAIAGDDEDPNDEYAPSTIGAGAGPSLTSNVYLSTEGEQRNDVDKYYVLTKFTVKLGTDPNWLTSSTYDDANAGNIELKYESNFTSSTYCVIQTELVYTYFH